MRCGRLLVWLVSLVLVLGACTSGDDGGDTSTTRAVSSTTTTTSTTEPPLDLQAHAEGLVVGIRSEGDFLNFDSPGILGIGEGSGIAIDSDGLILTAATAVVGADRINVYVAGEEFPLVGQLDAAVECANLALVRIDHTFTDVAVLEGTAEPVAAATAVGDRVTVATPRISRSAEEYRLAGFAAAGGAALFDETGALAGVVTGVDSNGSPVALGSDLVVSWVEQMRRRDVVQQLGFTAVNNTEGQAIVTALSGSGPGSAVALGVGDVISKVEGEELTDGVAQLCAAFADGAADIEVFKEGRRHVGALPDERLVLASARTTDQIRQAVVEVQTPDGGSGSGFFVSADGLLVTNFHVAGPATDVTLRFDASEASVAGEVVAAAACSDLAVIQAEPGTYEYLEWAPQPPALDQSIRVVGFPNLTDAIGFEDGIVAKEDTPSQWWVGSIRTFETSADIDRGNSGGPVVNLDGEVVGVTYAYSEGSTTWWEQDPLVYNSLHLVGTEAREVVDGILDGSLLDPGFALNNYYERNVDGVTGYTVEVGEIAPTSPAAALGLEPLDEIVVFGDVRPTFDFTGYDRICELLASRDTKDPVDVVVWRYSDDSLYDGQLYGEPLTKRPDPYRLATADDTISAVIPGRWTDTDEIVDDERDWIGYWAATDLDAYFNDFGEAPGMRLMWSYERAETHTTVSYLEGLSYAGQASGSIQEYGDGRLVGHYQVYQFPGGVAREYALTIAGEAASPMILLFLADAEHRIDRTATQVIESLRIDLADPDE